MGGTGRYQTHVISEQNLGGGGGAMLIGTVVMYRFYNLRKYILISIQKKLSYCIRQHHEIQRCGYETKSEKKNGHECFYRWEFADFIFTVRYTQVLEDTMIIPCVKCCHVFIRNILIPSPPSRKKYLFQLLAITACYIIYIITVYREFLR